MAKEKKGGKLRIELKKGRRRRRRGASTVQKRKM